MFLAWRLHISKHANERPSAWWGQCAPYCASPALVRRFGDAEPIWEKHDLPDVIVRYPRMNVLLWQQDVRRWIVSPPICRLYRIIHAHTCLTLAGSFSGEWHGSQAMPDRWNANDSKWAQDGARAVLCRDVFLKGLRSDPNWIISIYSKLLLQSMQMTEMCNSGLANSTQLQRHSQSVWYSLIISISLINLNCSMHHMHSIVDCRGKTDLGHLRSLLSSLAMIHSAGCRKP